MNKNNTVSKEGNSIEMKSLIELRDGRTFYVPAYQRGYRWNEEQVKDLLEDLYSFASGKNEKQFYCLQPIIVKKISKDSAQWKAIIETHPQINQEKEIYEVVDGQQRLTTLYILLQYIIDHTADEEDKEDEQKAMYKLIYETRKNLSDYLQKIGEKTIFDNIDEKHASNAYQCIKRWIENKKTPNLKASNIRSKLATFLCQDKNTEESCGSLQVVWYEIDENKDVIREFLTINNGKIQLTEAELIKALFLQKRNLGDDNLEITQGNIALEWERIENALHEDDFWYFLSNENKIPSNRIELLLRLNKGVFETDKNKLFRSYYGIFSEKEGLSEIVKEEWKNVVTVFRTLEDWYIDPIKYNLIGFLTHAGTPLQEIYKNYENSTSQIDFISRLEKMIKIKNPVELSYSKDRSQIRNILLLLNVHILNKQLGALREHTEVNSPSYKFPFDIFVAQNWDVEHIDSAQTNRLNKIEDQKEWIKVHKEFLPEKEWNEKVASFELEENWEKCIEAIKEIAEEKSEEEDNRNIIGNLTLLDAETNRSYGNALFPRKRKEILEAIRNGKYVPQCTQMIFYKNFGETSLQNSLYWSDSCKKAYQDYILNELKEYGKQ
ncbi:DUF262 domain-containing protein [Capnocytophaga gingivalis]|jgi:hypothetical protein|uniref:DUF262 domain-containing protein n=1 Tax=Capnocytophaga gingivalis TaxID=1017 RepID=UPI0028EA0A34|nr:DUF262 domain-containing protein [Capnocytophaga gingivalis]